MPGEKTPVAEAAADDGLGEIETVAAALVKSREKPLLVLFWPHDSGIDYDDIAQLHEALTATAGLTRAQPLEAMDVVVHTYGGEPTVAYRLAQLIRDYVRVASFVVPEYAYSGGTLICLAADRIELGDYAILSPIDITLLSRTERDPSQDEAFPDEMPRETEVELVAIDYFIQVAKNARVEIEREFRRRGWRQSATSVDSDLLCEMTRQLGVLRIAKYYRERNVTQEYARELLRGRMFANLPEGAARERIERVLRRLVLEAPAHEFALDYNICAEIGLAVGRLSEADSAIGRQLMKLLTRLASDGKICPIVGRHRTPFFQFFPSEVGEAPAQDAFNEPTTRLEASLTRSREEHPSGNGRSPRPPRPARPREASHERE